MSANGRLRIAGAEVEVTDEYQKFQEQIFDELDFLTAPKASDTLASLLEEAGWQALPLSEVVKKAHSVEEKYFRAVFRHSRKHPNWPLTEVMEELNYRRSVRELRSQALLARRIVKLKKEVA